MFAYEIGGEVGPGCKEYGVDCIDSGGGNWTESGLMEVVDEVRKIFLCICIVSL